MPSNWYGFCDTGVMVFRMALPSEVTSFTRPASICCLRTPPPQVTKMSGSFPEAVSAVIFDLNASFSRLVSLILTFGCEAS